MTAGAQFIEKLSSVSVSVQASTRGPGADDVAVNTATAGATAMTAPATTYASRLAPIDTVVMTAPFESSLATYRTSAA